MRRLVPVALLALSGIGCASTGGQRRGSYPAEAEVGLASFYGPGFYGRQTANGEIFSRGTFTAAHRTMPFGTCLEVQVVETGKRSEVRVNDRGPFVGGRVLDVAEVVAERLGFREQGVARVAFWRCAR
ncbi:MAG: septal ring lytic transglycosylase RlpA family protein [Myxococcaceae bacterium]